MGVRIHGATRAAADAASRRFLAALAALGLDAYVEISDASDAADFIIRYRLREDLADILAPNRDTTQLCTKLNLDAPKRPQDLEREILLGLMLSPIPVHFPSYEELRSAVNIRRNIADAAKKLRLPSIPRRLSVRLNTGVTVRPPALPCCPARRLFRR